VLGMPPEPPRRRWMTWRVVFAAVGVICVSAGATAAIALNEVGRLAEALEQNKPVELAPHVLAPTTRGAPETLLLVGNDERPTPKYNPAAGPVLPHSNEMLLVRIDPSKPTISMLSIPRELKVPIVKPNGEVTYNRINSAFTFGWENGGGTAGGVRVMVETVKRVLGLQVNHVFVTNFKKFAEAVNAMGCVYMTVDKRYYHHNEPGGEQYFEINLHPGYQKLCGLEALEFVANRHESTSLIRDARDQRFLLETKAQYGPSLLAHRERFERIFGRYVESTLRSEDEILQLLYLLIESAGKPVRQVDFHVSLEPTFDSASPGQIHEAVQSFLEGTTAIAHHAVAAATAGPHPAARRAAGAHRRATAHRPAHASTAGFSLAPTTASELAQARAQAPNLPFPLEYPKVRDGYAAAEPDELRVYQIHDLHGRVHPIYCIVIDRGELGQYYDVQGTDWGDPPMLGNPGQTVEVGSRTYELFYAGERLRAIAWREHGAVYWIENTLTDDVSERALLAMAEQTVPVVAPRAAPSVSAALARAARVHFAPHSTAVTTGAELEALLGFVGLGVVGLLAVFVLARQRELRGLRDAVAGALALETRQRPLLAGAGAGVSVATPAVPAAPAIPDAPSMPAVPVASAAPGAPAASADADATRAPGPAFVAGPRTIYRASRLRAAVHRVTPRR
jgi:polyisoprenyl-teichoic acid--peptidoglycan teichoic acid transferase